MCARCFRRSTSSLLTRCWADAGLSTAGWPSPFRPAPHGRTLTTVTSSAFVHLRVHSAYSMLASTLRPKAIPALARALGQPAVALTDTNALFAAMEFGEAGFGKGVQPIIGATICVEGDALVLLAQDEGGYANLVRLVSRAHLVIDGVGDARLAWTDLEGASDGLIALTAGPDGALSKALAGEQRATADALADRLEALFPGRLYVELSRMGDVVQEAAEPGLIALAHARGLPLVATNPVRFADPGGHAAHDALMCIAQSAYVEAQDRTRSNPHAWMKPAALMTELFADVPEAVANTLTVARRCAVAAPARPPILPRLEGDLRAQAADGLAARLAACKPVAERSVYDARLDYEVGVIEAMGFSGYFLIVADFIGWAKRQGIPVGPGRGSGAGSVVAWALGITDLDPLAHGLLFERFLNPERVSMPDFDIDFCETRREEVIRYVSRRYGADRVAQIITFGTLKSRAVVKDVGRVLQMPYGQMDRLSKLIPNNPADPWTLSRALEGVPELALERDRDPRVAQLFNIGLQLEGLPRHASTHAAGVVIGDRPLSDLVPLYRDPRSDLPVTQFDMKWVEKAGLVKFDFLGLKTLSVLERARVLLAGRGVEVDWLALPLDDPAVYALLTRGDTVGVFQFEGEGMRRTLGQAKPDRFADIIALGALYRPGPMDNIPSFVARKHGREKVELPHPALNEVLGETYGLIVYQEQVMSAAQKLAGYSLGEADLLRRAMGKKIKAEMDAQRARFVSGAVERGVAERQAGAIFELIAKFAGYGFNKSHAAAYAMISYQTAWLKAHHPTEFYAASMTFDRHLTDKLGVFVEDARRLGTRVLPPCVQASAAGFTVEDGAVRYALAGLKGVGERAMEAIVEARATGGPFRSLSDFAARIDPTLLNKRMVESLAAAGAFDSVEPNRAAAHGLAEALLAAAASAHEARTIGQHGLFGEGGGAGGVELLPASTARWTAAQAMAAEREACGFFLSGHPLDAYRTVLLAERARPYAELMAAGGPGGGGRTSATLAGLIEGCRWRTPPSGNRYLMVDLSDHGGGYTASAFDDAPAKEAERLCAAGGPVLIQAELLWRDGDDAPRVAIRGIRPLAEVARRVSIRVEVEVNGAAAAARLGEMMRARRGGRTEIVARVALPGGGLATLRLGRDFAPDPDAMAALADEPGLALAG